MLCFCGLPARTFETQEVENSNRKKLQEVVAGQTVFFYKCHVGGRNAQRLLAMLSIR